MKKYQVVGLCESGVYDIGYRGGDHCFDNEDEAWEDAQVESSYENIECSVVEIEL